MSPANHINSLIIQEEKKGNCRSYEYMSTNIAGVNASFYRKYHRNLINYVFIYRVIIC